MAVAEPQGGVTRGESVFMEGFWHEQDTTPSAIEAALRKLLEKRHAQDESYAPARALNLVVVVDREWRGEVVNRLERVGRYHPSRTVVCAVEDGRTKLDAFATMQCEADPTPGVISTCTEQVEIEVGSGHLPHLATIVDPLLVHDLVTLCWSPHGHPEAVESLTEVAEVVMLDSVEEPDLRAAIEQASRLSGNAYVVDLAWLRSTPWRERIAASFDPPQWRPGLRDISRVTVRHEPASAMSGLLVLGWLTSRLGWEPGPLVSQPGADGAAAAQVARARTHRREIELRLEPQTGLDVPGLAGMTVETSAGMSLSLDRGSGGLTARRRAPDGHESSWTLLGASRGEAGILGEGVRQALLRDPTYQPALASAGAMLA